MTVDLPVPDSPDATDTTAADIADAPAARPGLVVRLLDGFADRWLSFWFTPASMSVFTAMRVLIGACSLAWALSMAPDLATFYFDDGLLPEPGYADHRLALFQWFGSDAAVVVVFVALVVASALVTVGWWVRLSAPVLWLAMMTMQLGAPSTLNAGDLMLRIWTAYLALFALVTPSRFLSVPLRGEIGPDGGRHWPVGPVWFVRLAQIQLTVVYPATAIAKLDGNTWREGTAALYALGLVDFERFWVPTLLRENLIVGNLMTWYTIGIELSLAFLLWTRRTRWFAIIAGLSLHVGFDYTMRLGFFLPAMAIGYLAFVRPDELERVLRRLPRRAEPAPATNEPADEHSDAASIVRS
jgi:hypothetical protein